VLMHDNMPTTPQLLSGFLDRIEARGYKAGVLPQNNPAIGENSIRDKAWSPLSPVENTLKRVSYPVTNSNALRHSGFMYRSEDGEMALSKEYPKTGYTRLAVC